MSELGNVGEATDTAKGSTAVGKLEDTDIGECIEQTGDDAVTTGTKVDASCGKACRDSADSEGAESQNTRRDLADKSETILVAQICTGLGERCGTH